MSSSSTMARLVQVIEGKFSSAKGRVTTDMTAADVQGWDSLSHSLLLLDVERSFGIELPVEEAVDLETVGDLRDLIDRTLARIDDGAKT